MPYKPHTRRKNAPRARRVASSVPGSTALQESTEYVVEDVSDNADLGGVLSAMHNKGFCIHTVLANLEDNGYTVIAWRFIGGP